jgi:hypothetical protein
MAIRSFTLTTAVGLGLLLPLQADAGQADVSLATGSAAAASVAPPGPATTSLKEAASSAAASMRVEVQTPPATPAPEPEPPAPSVTGGVGVDLFSHYVWRGFVLTDRFSIQPSVFVSTHGLTVTSWSSWASTGVADDGSYPDCFDSDCPALREHDLTIDYTKSVGKATVSVGYINYLFPGFRTDTAKAADAVGVTNELYAGVAFAAPASPFVKLNIDVDGDDGADVSRGAYLQFGVAPAFAIADGKATLTPMFAIAYNFKEWIPDNDWNDANFGLKVAIPVNSHFTITPAAYVSVGLNDTVRSVGYGGDPGDPGRAKFYGGVSLGYSF